MKRICIVVGAHPDQVMGGAQYQAACLAERLAAEGYRVFYLARQTPADTRGYPYEIRNVGGERGLGRYGLLFDARRLLGALEDIRPHVVYQRVLHAYTGISALYGWQRRTPLVYHVSSDQDVTLPHPPAAHALGWLERRVAAMGLARADCVVTQTETQATLLKAHYRRNADRIVPNFHPAPAGCTSKPATPVTVLWIGNFKAVKRPDLFVRLAEDLGDLENVRFVMLGRKVERYAHLEERMAGVRNLTAPGEVHMTEVNRLLARGHVLVNTSEAEGFPNTFIQAWLRRVPVVSLGVDPDHVLARHGAGRVAQSYDELKRALVELLGDRSLRETLGGNAARYALTHHSPANVNELIDLIATLC